MWALAEVAWYRRAHVISWPRMTGSKPLPRKVVLPPVAKAVAAKPADAPPAPARDPIGDPIDELMAASAAEREEVAPLAPQKSSRRRRRAASAATAGA